MIDKYKINTLDIFTTYGLVARKGMYNELLKLPKRKPGYERNWPDQNGTERDFSTVYFESRILNLPFYLYATSEVDFFSKLTALQTSLFTPSRFDFDCIDMNRRFKLVYLEMTEFNKMTILKENDKIFTELSIQVADDFPTTILSIT